MVEGLGSGAISCIWYGKPFSLWEANSPLTLPFYVEECTGKTPGSGIRRNHY